MKAAKTPPPAGSTGRAFPLLLAVILAILFAKSFLPDYVHFSNDGPLGEINAAKARMPGPFTGSWDDLNDIGTNGGAAAPDISSFAGWILGPVGYSKFYTPIVLFILGLGAWTFFRQLKLSPLAAALGAMAVALNSSYVGNACWGTSPQQIAMAMVFFALALVMANSNETPRLIRWSRMALAGMAVGISVMEGADNGAIFSLFVAAYVFFKSLIEENTPALKKFGRGIGRVAVIAAFAIFIAWQTVTALIGTYIIGVAGMGQDKSTETSQQHWDWATQWSLPKKETLGIFIPGLFGYRMDTPKGMMDSLQDAYKGGEYWGGMGRTPEIDRYFDTGQTASPPSGPGDIMRFGYAGYYCGILVALVALFAILQSLRQQNSIFPQIQRHFIWFWTAVLIVALLLSWGRFAPFYHFLYLLPYFSTIRNPAKFMAIFYLAMAIIFAYGVDALSRRYLLAANNKSNSTGFLANLRGFDRKWSLFSVVAFAVGVLAWLVYMGTETGLVDYLQNVGFDKGAGKEIAEFSAGQFGWFLLFFGAAIVLVILVLAGVFLGKRARLGGLLLGALLVADLGRANLPWIIHWNYKQKYEIAPNDSTKSTNPIINLLLDKPFEHRVTDLRSDSPFESLYRIEWMQHHFPYYNVQCLDVIQSPRVTSDLAAYDMALMPTSQSTSYLMARRWQLSNTSYLLGPAAFLDSLNEQLDPVQHRFHIIQRFNIAPKPGAVPPIMWPDQLTASPDDNGDYALFEFSGALPRAALYTNWQVDTNGVTALQTLTSQNFDPQKTVMVSTPLTEQLMTNSASTNSGTVEFSSYAPKTIVLKANAAGPSVLLLNDRFDPNWHVSVDDKPAELLRCNYIMRGVFLPAGSHTVEFQFSLPHKPLYVTLAAMGVAVCLGGVLFFSTRKTSPNAKK